MDVKFDNKITLCYVTEKFILVRIGRVVELDSVWNFVFHFRWMARGRGKWQDGRVVVLAVYVFDIKRQALTLMSSLGGIDCHCWKNRGRNKKEARVTSWDCLVLILLKINIENIWKWFEVSLKIIWSPNKFSENIGKTWKIIILKRILQPIRHQKWDLLKTAYKIPRRREMANNVWAAKS